MDLIVHALFQAETDHIHVFVEFVKFFVGIEIFGITPKIARTPPLQSAEQCFLRVLTCNFFTFYFQQIGRTIVITLSNYYAFIKPFEEKLIILEF